MTQTKGTKTLAGTNRIGEYYDKIDPQRIEWNPSPEGKSPAERFFVIHACDHASLVLDEGETAAYQSKVQSRDWMERFQMLLERVRIERRVDIVEKSLKGLAERVERLDKLRESYFQQAVSVAIATFAPEPYEVVKPLHALIRRQDKGFLASFLEANIEASGDSEHEALENLKGTILRAFEQLSDEDESTLGPGQLRQRFVLTDLVRPVGEGKGSKTDESTEKEECGDSEVELFLAKVYSLSHTEQTDRAIDDIFEQFEDLIQAGKLEVCDRILDRVDVMRLNPTLMISFLVITLGVKDRLSSRQGYFSRVQERITEERGEERARKLLRGLD